MILQKWKQCGIAVQGKDHVKAGTPCQDNVAYAAENGVYAAALSDGGGSRRFSEVGSAVSTRTVCDLLVSRFDELYDRIRRDPSDRKLKEEILRALLSALRAELREDRTLRDFGCTLQFVARSGDRYIAGHIGDGVIAVLRQAGLSRRVEVLSHPENGGAPNITFFLTDGDAPEHLRLSCGESRNAEGFLMMSDGPEEVLYSPASGMHPNTLKLFDNFRGIGCEEYTKALGKFLETSIAEHSYDDLSFCLLYLETVEPGALSPAYGKEFFAGITAKNQVTAVSSYASLLDASVPPFGEDDMSYLRE